MKLTLQLFLASILLADANSLWLFNPFTSAPDESSNVEDSATLAPEESSNVEDSCNKKVVTYGAFPVLFQNDVPNGPKYLSEGDKGEERVYVYDRPDEWVLLSQLPNGLTDPKYGECVKFGDTVIISNANVVGKLYNYFRGPQLLPFHKCACSHFTHDFSYFILIKIDQKKRIF